MNRVAAKRKPIRKRAIKLRTNGKHKVDAASTISAPVGFGMNRIIRPQARFNWLMPNVASVTPQFIEMTLNAALAGNHVQQYALFDLMLRTWPELSECYQQLIYGVQRKKMIFEPFHEEDEKPTPSAIERSKVVSNALRNMNPPPADDGEAMEGTVKNILDAWFRGVSVSEIVWEPTQDAIGQLMAPKCTYWVDPVAYAFSGDNSLGLRPTRQSSGGVYPFPSTATPNLGDRLVPFPDNKFLIGIHKAKAGSPLGGPLLTPLAWWWCAANFSSDWLMNLAQVFGLPFRWANYDPNAPQATIDAVCNMLQNMGSAGWAAFPIGTTLELKDAGKGSDHSPQGELLDRADRYARSLILGQTMTGTHGTTGKGGGQAFGEVEADVKGDRIDAAGKFAATVINQQLVKAILLLNYGDDSEAPCVRFLEDEEAGPQEATRDKVLIKDVGLEVSKAYLRKKYGLPEPEDEEDTIGGDQLPQGFGGFGNSPFGQPPNDQQPQDQQPPDNQPATAGDAPGHAFRGNQYVRLGDYVQTPHGRGMVVANDYGAAWVSVNGSIRKYPMKQITKIPYDHSNFPSITHSAEDERRKALNMKLALINEIKDDKIFARELAVLAGVEIEEPKPAPDPPPPPQPQVINVHVEAPEPAAPTKKSFSITRSDGGVTTVEET